MTTLKKYKQIFVKVFSIKDTKKIENLKYQDVEEWDSIGHMTLMSELENAFNISIETDDIVDFSSYKKGQEILEKYKVKLN